MVLPVLILPILIFPVLILPALFFITIIAVLLGGSPGIILYYTKCLLVHTKEESAEDFLRLTVLVLLTHTSHSGNSLLYVLFQS